MIAEALIGNRQPWVLMSVILSGVAVSIFLEQKYKWAAKISGPVLGLLIAMTLSTIGIMPTGGTGPQGQVPTYEFIGGFLMPMAIPLLLFQANLLRIIKVTGKMFLAFHVSVLGTVIGAVVATLALSHKIEHAPEVAGIMTASYSGGSVNFFAVKASFADVVTDELTNPLIVADNFIMAGMFLLLLVMASSRFFLRHFPHPSIQEADIEDGAAAAAKHWEPKPIGLRDISTALAISFVIATIARTIATGFKPGPDETSTFAMAILGNVFVWITVISLAVATAFPRQLEKIRGANELGGYLLYVYLFSIGLPANLIVVLQEVPDMFLFCAIIAIINLVVTLSVGKLLRLNLEDLLICVNATLGGPPSAVAMAISKGWPKLVLPAMLVGIWGYVIGTALGVAIARLLQDLV
jgi:uncharacterized membrane protein